MPMGEMGDVQRIDQYWSLKDLRARLETRFTLTDLAERESPEQPSLPVEKVA